MAIHKEIEEFVGKPDTKVIIIALTRTEASKIISDLVLQMGEVGSMGVNFFFVYPDNGAKYKMAITLKTE